MPKLHNHAYDALIITLIVNAGLIRLGFPTGKPKGKGPDLFTRKILLSPLLNIIYINKFLLVHKLYISLCISLVLVPKGKSNEKPVVFPITVNYA